jgi:hypothetical protein
LLGMVETYTGAGGLVGVIQISWESWKVCISSLGPWKCAI